MLKVTNMADLPAKWRLFDAFYNKTSTGPKIQDDMRQHVVALIEEGTLAAQSKVIVVVMKNSRNLSKISLFLRSSLGAVTQGVDIRTCEEKSLLDAIYEESKKKENSSFVQLSDEDAKEISKVKNVLADAMDMKASDVHVETQNGVSQIRLRVFTEMLTYDHITTSEAERFANICYSTFTSSEEETGTAEGAYQKTSLLEGEFSAQARNHNIRARMMNLAYNDGVSFDFICRLIDKNKSSAPVEFRDLGFSNAVSEKLEQMSKSTQGAILIVGITGSGKSTSQQNFIKFCIRDSGGRKKIITLEDPVEYPIEGTSQITVSNSDKEKKSSEDFGFENLNAKLLRSDPDDIGYGEIRDINSARAAYKGVESGHKVYGTMHTSSALAAFPRLLSFGLEKDAVCKDGFIAGVLYQHLIPKLCPHCSISHTQGELAPEKYDETFIINNFITNHQLDESINLKVVNDVIARTPKGQSVIRQMQKERLINSMQTANMITALRMANKPEERIELTERLNKITLSSGLTDDMISIRFRGQGCEHCFRGHVGVVPCGEAIIPDKQLLDLIRANKTTEAEIYWKSALGGKSAIEDSYSKIFSGTIDPRYAEAHLGTIGK